MEELILAESVKQLVKHVFNKGNEYLKNTDVEMSYDALRLRESLIQHVTFVKNWSKEVSFNEAREAKSTTEIYVELDIYLYPTRIRMPDEQIDTIPLKKILSHTKKHIVLLGQVGAGKTTSMKTLCNSVLYDEDFYDEEFSWPVLIRFRDFNLLKGEKEKLSLVLGKLREIFCLHIETKNLSEERAEFVGNVKDKLVLDILNTMPILLILEGFDEINYRRDRDTILKEIAILAQGVEKSRIIITSRPSDFNYSIENVSKFDIAPLSESQIIEFSQKWLMSPHLSEDFIKQIKSSPFYDTSIKPLNLAHLCAIYERIGRIPDKPKTVYRKLVNLLLEEWDEQRMIRRKSKYAKFEVDRKIEFLSALAFKLTTSAVSQVFRKSTLKSQYISLYEDFDLKRSEAGEVVNEIESHTGLIIQSGYDQYEFAHKSLQEYLCAEYIVKLPYLPHSKLSRIPNEMAVAVAISSNPSEYFYSSVARIVSDSLCDSGYLGPFINRLILEKPDFRKSKKLGLAFLVLYSKYIGSLVNNGGQLSIFIWDRLIKEFEVLVKVMQSRTSFGLILRNYNFLELVADGLGGKIAVYELKVEKAEEQNKIFRSNDHEIWHPEKLYVRNGLFAENER